VIVWFEPAFERDGGVGQTAGQQGLHSLPGLEDLQCPVLPIALRLGNSGCSHLGGFSNRSSATRGQQRK